MLKFNAELLENWTSCCCLTSQSWKIADHHYLLRSNYSLEIVAINDKKQTAERDKEDKNFVFKELALLNEESQLLYVMPIELS